MSKQHACVYCGKLLSKMSCHLTSCHQNEAEVPKVLIIRKRTKQRFQAWGALVNKGDYSYNINAITEKKGVLIPKYRARYNEVERQTTDLIPCEFCFALFAKHDLHVVWRHRKSCYMNPGDKKTRRGEGVANGRLLLPTASSHQLNIDIITRMRDDEVKTGVVSDSLIIKFGNRLVEKHGTSPEKINYISNRLRELERLKLECKSLEQSLQSITHMLNP